MTKYTMLILKNLLRSKRRTVLTVLSIGVSLFIFSVLVSLPTFANQMLADTASSVRIACRTKMGLDYPLPETYKVKIATTPHVVAVVPDVFFGGIYHEASDQFPSIAMDAENIDVMFPDWGFSREGVEQFKKIKTACMVAQGTMRRFNLHVGQRIQIRGTVFPFNVTLTIVGPITKGPSPSFLIFRRDYFEEAAGRPGIVDNFWVRVDDSKVVPQVAAALDQQFANSSAETQSDSEEAFMGSILGRFRIFMKLAELLGLVVVIAIGLVAANTAAMSIRERRSEIAVMRSIGFPSQVILSLLVGESLVIALLGGALGCGVAFGLLKAVALNADALGPFVALRIPPFVLLETLVVALLIGVLSAYVPARAATRRSIVETLRLVD
jgi:putative ABC transport system permease protein